jgi:hypothetical protein
LPVNEPEESLDIHTADVAPPPNDPLKAAVVPPWHIATGVAPMLTVGVGLTVKVVLVEIVPQEPPPVVSVSATVEGAYADAVYVVIPGVRPLRLSVEKVPPASPSVHIADVAPPLNDPLKAAVVPPWHIAAGAVLMLTVGLGLTVKVVSVEIVPHTPPPVVSVNVTKDGEPYDAI